MEYFLIYLIGTVDGFIETFNFIGAIGAIGCLALFFMFRAQDTDSYVKGEEKEMFRRASSKSFKGFMLFLILFIFTQLIPNSKTLIAMATIPPVPSFGILSRCPRLHKNEQRQDIPESQTDIPTRKHSLLAGNQGCILYPTPVTAPM